MKYQCPKVSVQSDKLILSLPDALTPVMWMIDIKDSQTFLMRIEQDDRGLFILQKLSGDGKKIEDIAYYSKKKNAVRAMAMITKTMSGKKCSYSKLCCVLSMIKSAILLSAAICILFITFFLFVPLGGFDMIFGSGASVNSVEQPIGMAPSIAPEIVTDPNSVGVPMSADDFLQQKGRAGSPF